MRVTRWSRKAIVWLFPILLVSLLLSSNSKESDLMTNLRKLKFAYICQREKQMKIVDCEWTEPPLQHGVDSEQNSVICNHIALDPALLYRALFSGIDWFGCEVGLVLRLNLKMANCQENICVRDSWGYETQSYNHNFVWFFPLCYNNQSKLLLNVSLWLVCRVAIKNKNRKHSIN